MQAHIPIIAKFLIKKSPSVFGNVKKKNGFDNSLYFPALQRATGVVINLWQNNWGLIHTNTFDDAFSYWKLNQVLKSVGFAAFPLSALKHSKTLIQ